MSSIRRTYIVLSTHVDSIIQEQLPDAKIWLFKNITDLSNYVETTPLRADKMFITREVLEPIVNTSLTKIIDILKNPFLKVESVEYITEENSPELPSVDYILQDMEIRNWEVVQGSLTREFVSGLISGSLRVEDVKARRKAVYRVRRDVFLEESKKNKEDSDMNEKYFVEEDDLAEVPTEDLVHSYPVDVPLSCEIINITGLAQSERTLFAMLFAQYLSHTHKTLIVEKDFKFLTLTDMVRKANIRYLDIPISNLYTDTKETLRKIEMASEKLIVITCYDKDDYDYHFTCMLLYSNLKDKLDYLVKENELDEVSESSKYIVFTRNNVVDIIRTCERIPNNYRSNARFSALNTTTVKELRVPNSFAIATLIKDLLQIDEDIVVPIFSVETLRGGDMYGLRMLIE